MTGETLANRVRFPELSSDSWELHLNGLAGVSVGALATAFAVESFSTAIDMGRCSALLAAQETVLLTHCHSDHVAGLIAWLSAHTRRHRDLPTRVVAPAGKREELLAALEIWPDLDGVRRRVSLAEALVGVRPGDSVDLAGGTAVAFAVRHNTTALGWALTREGAARPEYVFAGDSTVEPFRDDPGLLDAAMAVVDCSFVDPGTRVAARLGGHAHLTDWIELLPNLACDTLVLAPGLDHPAAVDRSPAGDRRLVSWVGDVLAAGRTPVLLVEIPALLARLGPLLRGAGLRATATRAVLAYARRLSGLGVDVPCSAGDGRLLLAALPRGARARVRLPRGARVAAVVDAAAAEPAVDTVHRLVHAAGLGAYSRLVAGCGARVVHLGAGVESLPSRAGAGLEHVRWIGPERQLDL